MSQIAVITVKAVTEAPELGQGDTEASPKPDPRASRISDNPAVAKAPPMIAAHEIAEIGDFKVWPASPAPRGSARLLTRVLTILVILFELDQCQTNASRMIIGMGTPNNHSRIPRPIFSSHCWAQMRLRDKAVFSDARRGTTSGCFSTASRTASLAPPTAF